MVSGEMAGKSTLNIPSYSVRLTIAENIEGSRWLPFIYVQLPNFMETFRTEKVIGQH
jgi:hypothetical protein